MCNVWKSSVGKILSIIQWAGHRRAALEDLQFGGCQRLLRSVLQTSFARFISLFVHKRKVEPVHDVSSNWIPVAECLGYKDCVRCVPPITRELRRCRNFSTVVLAMVDN